MIIKEFRVVVPMSVEEYQIGQLYTIQKKSRLETTGAGSGVEIIENRPYESKTEKGQYTLKVYHVDERLPAGLKTLSKLLFPKSALLFEEESWNCYPYTRTKYSHKFFKSFYVDIESRYLADLGQSDNVFNLSSSELAQRSVDYIDIVNDPISPNEYKTETDPQLFVSAKTNRGPMHPQWLEEMRSSASSQADPSQSITGKKTRSLLNGRPVEFMCCYKLCRIECAFWGCQSRVEKLVSESVIRHMVFLSHREAWCWQDEYFGLTMQDVRELENETQRYLNAKMRNNSLMEEDLASLPNQSKKNSTEVAVAASSSSSSHTVSAAAASKQSPTSPTSSTSTIKGDTSSSSIKSSQSPQASPVKQQQPQQQQQTSQPQPVTTNNLYGKKTSIVSVAKSIETDSGDDFEDFPSSITNTSPVFDQMNHRNNPNIYFKNDVGEEEEFVEQNYSGEEEDDMNEQQVPFGNSSDEDRASQHSDEFFDAISQVSFNFSTNTTELDNKSTHTVNLPTTLGPTTKKKKPVKLVIKDSKQSEQQNKQQTAVAASNTTKQTPQTQTTTPTKNIELSRSIFNNSTTSSSSSNSSASASSAPVNRANTATTNVAASKVSSSSSSTVTAASSAMKSGPSQPNRSGVNASANRSNIDVLLLVVHGGNVTCTDTSKQSDFSNFKSTMESVIKSNYAHLQGRIAYRLVPCDSICKDVLVKLAALSPIVNQQTCSLNNVLNDSDDFAETSAAVFSVHESLPFNTLPLLATANSLQYRNHLSLFIRQCNKVYQEFLQSIGGFNADGSCAFNGQVVIVGDSLGSILAYDALTQINVAGSTRASDEHLSSSASSVVHPTTTTAAPTTPNSGGGGGGDNRNRSTSPRRKESSSSSSTGGGGSAGIGHTNPIISINDEERRMSLLQQQDTVSLEASTHRKHHHHHHHHHSKNHHRSPSNKMIRNLSDSEFVTPTTSTASFLTPNSPSQLLTTAANDLSRSSSMTYVDERLEFQVAHFFIFGSPLGLVLAYRKIGNNQLEPPIGSHIYNLFHLTDPIAVRIEPLLCKQFKYIDPCMVPRYSKFPLGDGLNLSLDHYIVKHGNLFDTKNLISDKTSGVNSNNDSPTIAMNNSSDIYFNTANSWLTSNNLDQLKSLQKILYTKKNWWGDNRIDYVLYAPEKITNLPRISLPYIFHSCYWESTDVVAFALRMIFRHEFEAAQAGQASINDMYKAVNASPLSAMAVGGRGGGGGAHGHNPTSAGSKEPVEKFQKRLNRVKLRNLSANHRANDVIVLEDKEQILTAKFSYGPLDFALSGEKVDIFITSSSSSSLVASSAAVKGSSSSTGVSSVPQTPAGEWRLLASAVTDSHGRLKYELPKDKRLVLGMYHIKCVVKCDHTFVDFQMAVLPVQTEAIVFSIDGSFAANISFSGTDPKVRAGAVDVVRYWQDLGYLIIYITARPDIQHYKVTNWLAQHNFPLGMVFFSEGICRDPLRQKTENLRSIVIGNQLKLQAGYGSPKDIPMYASLGVAANRIFIIGKAKSKYLNHAVFLQDGYASHLTYLQNPNTGCRQATGNARLIIKKATFTVKHNTLFSNPTSSLVASSTTATTSSEVVATKPSSLVIDPTKSSKSKLQTPPPGTIIPPILPSQQQQQSTTNSMSSKSSLHDSMRSTHSESSARTGNHSNSLRQTPSSAPIPNSINVNSATTTSATTTTTTSSNNNNNDNTHRHLAFPFHA